MRLKAALAERRRYAACLKLVQGEERTHYYVWHTSHDVRWSPKHQWTREEQQKASDIPWACAVIKKRNSHQKRGYVTYDIQRNIGVAPQMIRGLVGEAIFLSDEWQSCETWPGLS